MKVSSKLFQILLLLAPLAASAQQLAVNRIEYSNGEVIVTYSLNDTVPGRTYTVNVYASRDNYINPLTNLTGDQGLQVKPGIVRTIRWNAQQELGNTFEEAVALEVRARVYVPFIIFDNFDKIKRGKHKDVTWRGGTRQNILNFELMNKEGERVAVIPNVPNSGHTSLLIPGNVKPGKGYTFKIVDSKNKDQVVFTESFTIKRKVPLPLIIVGVAAIGGGVALLSGGSGEGGSGSTGPGDIVGPPDAPEN